MHHRVAAYFSGFLIPVFILSACSPDFIPIPRVQFRPTKTLPATDIPTPFSPILPTQTSTPLPVSLWVGSSVPDTLRKAVENWDIPTVDSPEMASLRLDLAHQPTLDGLLSTWIYALVAPFPTIIDGITSDELRLAWEGTQPEPFTGQPLLMEETTLNAFIALWGAPAPGSVRIETAERLLDIAWDKLPSWAIVPFESLEPRWKVLSVDGQSPVHNDFDPFDYPLVATFNPTCVDLCPLTTVPTLTATNRDPSKLTVLVMTGVTALVRATAFTMEAKGITYPGRDIGDWLRNADIAHISNEIPFYGGCPFPNPNQSKLVFCSDPRYIELLEDVGIDVVELTGNHFADYGTEAMKETLAIYNEKGLPYYGGGANLDDSQKPLLLENNGNKIAFIGCNPVDTGKFPTATETRPGAAPCDFKYMTEQISRLHNEGYLVIATFQYHEYYSPEARPGQQQDFRLMADAGAVIVSGSQAHFAQVMEFYNRSFIHYGLGNLFFDQMFYTLPDGQVTKGTRREFIDRHVFYDGRYISTELLTAMLEDYSRPRPMTPDERNGFLLEYFAESGWIPFVETPTPGPTLTLTPLLIPTLSVTPVWTPPVTPTITP